MIRSFETMRFGKMDIRVFREQAEDYKHEMREPKELKAFVELIYHLPIEEIAREILSNYLGAVRVEINDWNHNGIIVER